jgi:hypothetical protein
MSSLHLLLRRINSVTRFYKLLAIGTPWNHCAALSWSPYSAQPIVVLSQRRQGEVMLAMYRPLQDVISYNIVNTTIHMSLNNIYNTVVQTRKVDHIELR